MDHEHSHPGTGHLLAYAGGSLWWVVDQLWRHGPGWSVVPPLCFGVAALAGALRAFLNDRQARRHAEELHRAKLRRAEAFAAMIPPRRNSN